MRQSARSVMKVSRPSLSLMLAVALALLGGLLWLPSAPVPTAPLRTLTPVDETRFINPFIGTQGSGDTFPGAVSPHGMMQWSPDNTHTGASYDYTKNSINYFALTNFSGRGCASQQDIGIMPTVGPLTLPPDHFSNYAETFSHRSEVAHPGRYQVLLATHHIGVELAAGPRTGMGQITFPTGTSNGEIIINTSTSAGGNTTPQDVQIDPSAREVTGETTSLDSCGFLKYTIHFALSFNRPFQWYGTWTGSAKHPWATSSSGIETSAFVGFDATTNPVVIMKAGISYVSVANAQRNLAAEQTGWSIATLASNTAAAWHQRIDQIQITGGSSTQETIFYTALYHSLIHPSIFSDVNGQYLGFDGLVHTLPPGHLQYSNIPGWDEYRTLFPLVDLLEPSIAQDEVQSLVNDASQDPGGGLPRWEMANGNSGGMEGDPADDIIATAYALGVTGFATSSALAAMLRGATNPKTTSSGHPVREGLSDDLASGYVAQTTDPWSASKTVQYSIDDFSLAQFARALGQRADYTTFLARSHNWQHLFNRGDGGQLMLRTAKGGWVPEGTGSTSGWREGTNSQYLWMPAHDLSALMSLLGGASAMNARLDTFFTHLGIYHHAGSSSPYAYMGNEPCEVTPYDYVVSGAPSKSQEVVRRIETQLYTDTPAGLPGNDDAGALSSWYVFSSLGLFPFIQGMSGLVLSTPLFPSVTVTWENGTRLTITTEHAGDASPYVSSAIVNGQADNTNPWLPFSAIGNGGSIAVMASGTANPGWGTRFAPYVSIFRRSSLPLPPMEPRTTLAHR